jgi:hypothetical protein
MKNHCRPTYYATYSLTSTALQAFSNNLTVPVLRFITQGPTRSHPVCVVLERSPQDLDASCSVALPRRLAVGAPEMPAHSAVTPATRLSRTLCPGRRVGPPRNHPTHR